MFKSLFAGLLLTLVSALSFAGGGSLALEELQERLAPMATLSADFTQTLTGADGYSIQQLTGKLTVARPGKVFWESEEPYPQQVVSDAKKIWLYDPDLAQVTVRPFDKDISKTPAILFIGEVEHLKDQYSVSKEEVDDRAIYWLSPLTDQSLYQKISLEFKDQLPVAMSLQDSLGQQTRIELTNVKINQPVEDSAFVFTIPDGVDVLYDD